MQSDLTLRVELRSQSGMVDERSFFGGKPVWIGRDPSCDFIVPDPSVSRRHICVESEGGNLQILDNSTNGSVVNGEFLHQARCRLQRSATLEIGPFEMRVRFVEANGVESGPGFSGGSQYNGPTPSMASAGGDGMSGSVSLSGMSMIGRVPKDVELRRRIHQQLLEHMDLASLDRKKMNMSVMRPKVLAALRRITDELQHELPNASARERLIAELCDEALGLGPLEKLLSDDSVSEIMVVDPKTIFYERAGKLCKSDLRFTDESSVRAVIERIVTPLGRRIDESTPIVDARLPDGSRVHAIIPPLALRGPAITIRKFSKKRLQMSDLIGFGALTERMATFLERSVKVRKNILVSGGTGSGKTTLLNVLSASISEEQRVLTIEDAAELRLDQSHVVPLESRPANMEGRGAYTIRDLVKTVLRMRPDRILVGECRGGEALDMLQAMNTGHDGSMTTIHANSPREAISRLETLALMAGLDLPSRAIRQQIATSIHLIVQQMRFSDGSRKIVSITEVGHVGHDGELETWEIFGFKRTGTGAGGAILGEFQASGYVPSYLDEFIAHGLIDGCGRYL